ncbi:hypothetical protein BDF22DRAFT_741575 [Syncephalis plumigaleata]|nr:hypothetical protein BDF22DRAFT_741575 [Syncephalis plumigaleata]
MNLDDKGVSSIGHKSWLVLPYSTLETATASTLFAGALLLSIRLGWTSYCNRRRRQRWLEHLASIQHSEHDQQDSSLLSTTHESSDK